MNVCVMSCSIISPLPAGGLLFAVPGLAYWDRLVYFSSNKQADGKQWTDTQTGWRKRATLIILPKSVGM